MTQAGKRSDDNDRLDQLGRALIKASAMTDDELEAAASPFLSRRVWARITAERERREASATWADLVLVGRRSVPAMLAVAVALAGWFWVGSIRPARPNDGRGEPHRDLHLERVVLSAATVWSDDDVLAFVINWPVAAAEGKEDRR